MALPAAGQRVFCLVESPTDGERKQVLADGVILEQRGVPEDADVVIGHGRITGPLAQELAAQLPGAKPAPVERDGVPHGPLRRLLLFGRAEDAILKGIDLAAAAIGQVVRRRSDWAGRIEFAVRGAPDGRTRELRQKILGWARFPGLEVDVEPYTADPAVLEGDLLTASVVLMPSRAEGFGLSGLEAVTYGTPVLISSASGLAELLDEALHDDREMFDRVVVRNTGRHDEDVIRWSTAIHAVLYDRRAAFDRAAELRAFLAAKYTWAGAAATVLESIRRLGGFA